MNICKMLQKVHFGEFLLQSLLLATSATFWFYSRWKIEKKCGVACVSKNLSHVNVASNNFDVSTDVLFVTGR